MGGCCCCSQNKNVGEPTRLPRRPCQPRHPMSLHGNETSLPQVLKHQGDQWPQTPRSSNPDRWPESPSSSYAETLALDIPRAAAICQPHGKTTLPITANEAQPHSEACQQSSLSERQSRTRNRNPDSESNFRFHIGPPSAGGANVSPDANFLGVLGSPPRGASRQGQVAAMESEQITRLRWKALKEDDSSDDDACAICCEALAPGDTAWRLPCGHCEWHEVCVHKWLRKHGTCPMCRAPMDIPWKSESSHSHVGGVKDPKDLMKPY